MMINLDMLFFRVLLEAAPERYIKDSFVKKFGD